MNNEKQRIRKKLKKKRDDLSREQVRKCSENICAHILESDLFARARHIYAYIPLRNEVDIRPVIRRAWELGKQVAVPKVFKDEMSFFRMEDFHELKEGAFHVMEPGEDHPVCWEDALVLVPGVAFDRQGNRMGFGKGYYDRYLARIPEAVTMGIAYEFQILEEIPVADHDRSMDWLATESEVRNIADVKAAMDFLERTKQYGSQLGLTSILHLMEELGNQQEDVPMVHIGGTNGKGSVGAMLSAALSEAGYRVGRFNTPDVFSYEEEFLMNGTAISPGRLAELFLHVKKACEALTAKGLPHPTRFEVETAAAFLWFAEENCDIALLEVGMGGETDATNLIRRPLVSVLTSISMDHMRFLGNSLEEIAAVKAGIIKPGCPVVSMSQKSAAMKVIRERCAALEAPCVCVGTKLSVASEPFLRPAELPKEIVNTASELSFVWKGLRWQIGLKGSFQVENALCALQVLELLQERYPGLTRETIARGLEQVTWPGRFECISRQPLIYLDGAHNEDAVKKLHDTLEHSFAGKHIVYILGVLADKEYEKMIRIMFREGDRIYTVTPPNPRALHGKQLASMLQEQKLKALYCENAKDAVSYAVQAAGQDGMVLAFGSLYNLNQVRRACEDYLNKK